MRQTGLSAFLGVLLLSFSLSCGGSDGGIQTPFEGKQKINEFPVTKKLKLPIKGSQFPEWARGKEIKQTKGIPNPFTFRVTLRAKNKLLKRTKNLKDVEVEWIKLYISETKGGMDLRFNKIRLFLKTDEDIFHPLGGIIEIKKEPKKLNFKNKGRLLLEKQLKTKKSVKSKLVFFVPEDWKIPTKEKKAVFKMKIKLKVKPKL